MHKKNKEINIIFFLLAFLFGIFLVLPLCFILFQSVYTGNGIGFAYYAGMFQKKSFLRALGNSFFVSSVSACITVVLAFILAFAVNYTNIPQKLKKAIAAAAVFPMLLPTITYGFAIIYSLGKEGLLTHILGRQLFDIYGFNGLVLGYVIYTLPIAFLLIHNTFQYIDRRFIIVSKVMGDNPLKTFWITCLYPLLGTLGAAFIQAFFLSFTDFGIPASVGGEFEVVAAVLYNEMLGAVPDFHNGAVVALVMLVPSVISILLLQFLERYNFRYHTISEIEIRKNKGRDLFMAGVSVLILFCMLLVFAVIFIIPFIKTWGYQMDFTLEHITNLFRDSQLFKIYLNSVIIAVLTAVCGTIAAYGAALVTQRSNMKSREKRMIETVALIINTIPGMVLGIAFMLTFSGTSLKNTILLIVVCNVVHFFSTPYLMIKNSLAKMNESWETTAMLMGDSWLKTIIRVITPNAGHTILAVLSYYFINAMVTISAVVFIVGARTMVITAKIKELQHFAKFDEIFALSLLLLATNLLIKVVFSKLAQKKR